MNIKEKIDNLRLTYDTQCIGIGFVNDNPINSFIDIYYDDELFEEDESIFDNKEDAESFAKIIIKLLKSIPLESESDDIK